jgi:hypothetical protein
LDGVPPSALEYYWPVKAPFAPPIQQSQANDVARFKAAAASPDARVVMNMLSPVSETSSPVSETSWLEVPGRSLKQVFDATFKRDVLGHDRTIFLKVLLTALPKPVPITFPVNTRGGKVEPGLSLQEMQSLLQLLREVEPLVTIQSVAFTPWDFRTTRAAEIKFHLKSSDGQSRGGELQEKWAPGANSNSDTKTKIEQRRHRILARLETSRNSILHRDLAKHFGQPWISTFYDQLIGFSWTGHGQELASYSYLSFRFRDNSDEISETSFDGNLSAFSVGALQKPLNALRTRLKLSQEDALKTGVYGRIEPGGKMDLSLQLPDKSNHRFSGALDSDHIEVIAVPPASN